MENLLEEVSIDANQNGEFRSSVGNAQQSSGRAPRLEPCYELVLEKQVFDQTPRTTNGVDFHRKRRAARFGSQRRAKHTRNRRRFA
jgi:hypothetical protein